MQLARQSRLAFTWSMWLSHVSLESNMIRRNFKLSFSTMRLLLSSKLRSRFFFFFLEKATAMHLGIEKVNFHCVAQSSILLWYGCRIISVSHLLLAEAWISMSSANSETSQPLPGGGQLAIITLNNKGLNKHPWGTPLLSFLSSDVSLSIRTTIFLSVRKFFSHRGIFPYVECFLGL